MHRLSFNSRFAQWLNLTCIGCLLFISQTLGPQAATTKKTQTEFPDRSLYPDVNTLELQELKKRLRDVIIVDLQSTYAHQSLRITNAIKIPIARERFVDDIVKLCSTTKKDITFYCNGKTCMSANLNRISAYDAGAMGWAKIYP